MDKKIVVGRERPQRPSSWWWNTWEAADRRDFRGWFYLPDLSPTEQMDSYSMRAIRERVDWLYKNVGAFAMANDGIAADEVGTGLWPKWITSSEDFNREVTDAYHYANHDPRVFSADGQHDAYSSQYSIRCMIPRYGDCFGQLLRPNPGAIFPQVNLIPGYRIDNIGNEREEEGWVHGVKSNSLGRPILYRVILNEGEEEYMDVPASDMLHFHEPFVAGQQRGVPAAAAVAKKMFRREDISKAVANGTLAREQVAWAIEATSDSPQGPRFNMPGANTTSRVKNKDGSAFTVQKLFGWTAGEQTKIPELWNKKLKSVESNRPSREVNEFQDRILREYAWARKYPAEYVFFTANMGQGTAVRLVNQRIKTQLNNAREFQLIPQFLKRHPIFWVWQAIIKPGRNKAALPDDWWKLKINPVPDSTVDLGREGRLYDDRLESNKISIPTYHALNGEDDDDVEDINLAVMARRCKKLNKLNDDDEVKKLGEKFGYFDVWPRTSSFARVQSNAAPSNVESAPGQPSNQPPPAKQKGNRNGHDPLDASPART